MMIEPPTLGYPWISCFRMTLKCFLPNSWGWTCFLCGKNWRNIHRQSLSGKMTLEGVRAAKGSMENLCETRDFPMRYCMVVSCIFFLETNRLKFPCRNWWNATSQSPLDHDSIAWNAGTQTKCKVKSQNVRPGFKDHTLNHLHSTSKPKRLIKC